jgi:hypothetical protein
MHEILLLACCSEACEKSVLQLQSHYMRTEEINWAASLFVHESRERLS